jgi:hypothetical protein
VSIRVSAAERYSPTMNAVPPPPPPAPSRTIAIACNVALVLLLTTSFAACSTYGCSSHHLEDNVAFPLAIIGAALSVTAGAAAIAIFVKASRTKGVASSVFGLVISILLTIASTALTPFFWLCAGSGAIGFGGWGRPLRVGFRRRAITPGVRVSTEWANGPRPDVRALSPDARALLRDLWLHDARKEHASVPAFGRVAWQLVALGAPADLVKRAHQSSIQEIDHAERCFALASSYAGEDLGVQPMPELLTVGAALPRDPERALEQVATEALIDGALLEDYNAELAATALPDVTDAAAREALIRVVEDEREHARLAWDIVAFCVERGGPRVVKALRQSFAKLAEDPVSLYADDLAARVAAFEEPGVLAAHGRVRADVIATVFRARKAYAAERLAAIVDGSSSAAERALAA